MSLFDLIKYPLSNPPTPEELFVLPPDIYNDWCRDWLGRTCNVYWASGYLRAEFALYPLDI